MPGVRECGVEPELPPERDTQARFETAVAGLAGVDVGADVGGEVALAHEVVALHEIVRDEVIRPVRHGTAQTHLHLLGLDRPEPEEQARLGHGVDRRGIVAGAIELTLGRGAEALVVRREQVRAAAQRIRGAQLGTQPREVGGVLRHLSVVARGPEDAGLHRARRQVIPHLIGERIVAQSGRHAQRARRGEFQVAIGRGALERDMIVVDPGAAREGTVDGIRARSGAGHEQVVLAPRTGAVIEIHAGDEARAEGGKILPPLRQHAVRDVVANLDPRVRAQVERAVQLHAVVAKIRREREQARAKSLRVLDRDPRRADLAVGDREIIPRRMVAVIGERQRGVGAGLLIDFGDADDRLDRTVRTDAAIEPEISALAIVTGAIAPAVGVGDVEVGAKCTFRDGMSSAQHEAARAERAEFPGERELRLSARRTGEDVYDPADRIGTVQRGAGSADDLDATRHGNIHLVKRVVVEEARRADRDPVLQEEIHRARGERLADGGGVALAVGDGDGDAGHLAEQLTRMERGRLPDRVRADGANRGGRFDQQRALARAGDGDGIEGNSAGGRARRRRGTLAESGARRAERKPGREAKGPRRIETQGRKRNIETFHGWRAGDCTGRARRSARIVRVGSDRGWESVTRTGDALNSERVKRAAVSAAEPRAPHHET